MKRQRSSSKAGDAGLNPETTMRSFLVTTLVATGASLAAIQLASAAATIPDYQARVNTASAFKQAPVRDARASINASAPAQANRVQFYETPARR